MLHQSEIKKSNKIRKKLFAFEDEEKGPKMLNKGYLCYFNSIFAAIL